MFIPSHYQYDNALIKSILLYSDFLNEGRHINDGQSEFLLNNCPVNRCTITKDRSEASKADAIIFYDKYEKPKHKKSSKQVNSTVFRSLDFRFLTG